MEKKKKTFILLDKICIVNHKTIIKTNYLKCKVASECTMLETS